MSPNLSTHPFPCCTVRSRLLMVCFPFGCAGFLPPVKEPLEVPDSYLNKSISNSVKQTYFGMATFMDESIGNITKALKAKGMWENTLVVWSADNVGLRRSVQSPPPTRFPPVGSCPLRLSHTPALQTCHLNRGAITAYSLATGVCRVRVAPPTTGATTGRFAAASTQTFKVESKSLLWWPADFYQLMFAEQAPMR